MIEARGLTKRYGRVTAVDDLNFSIAPGRVTGFLGPNGAGKTTTMRLVLGLDEPTSGTVRIAGHTYRDLRRPLTVVGALLDAAAVHPGRTIREHLRWMAKSNGLSLRRVDEMIEFVGLQSVTRRRARTLSLGMRQRLGIAGALLGDPAVLLFDEPVNGLDPEGIVWVRNFLRSLAAEGRTVLVSSHLMSEMALTADHLLLLGRGRLIADTSVEQFLAGATELAARVVSPEHDRLAIALGALGARVSTQPDGSLAVIGLETAQIGEVAQQESIVLHELTRQRASLEEAYMELTSDSLEFAAHAPKASPFVAERPRPEATR